MEDEQGIVDWIGGPMRAALIAAIRGLTERHPRSATNVRVDALRDAAEAYFGGDFSKPDGEPRARSTSRPRVTKRAP
jgi:hypothetical protein